MVCCQKYLLFILNASSVYFLFTECPKPTMFTSGRFILTGNGSVLSEQCSDGFSIITKPRYNCIDEEWVEIDSTGGTCKDLGKL